MLRKRIFLAAIAAAFLGGHAGVRAQAFPNKSIYIVVPYNPSGLPDALARVIGQKVSENTGQQVIVENKPGASGIIGAQYFLSKAAPDGHTLFVVDNNTYAINAAVYPNLVYKPSRDLALVTQATSGYMYLAAPPSANIGSVHELIAQAKANPGAINYGSPGNATLHHLGMEQLALMAGAKFTHVPYKGVAEANPGLLRGDVSVMFAALTSIAPYAKTGRLRILAVGSSKRSSLTPDVPTVAESGFPDFEVVSNMGFAVRAGTPRPIIERLNAELVKALKSPDVAAKIKTFGVDVVAGTPEQFTAQLTKDQEKYARLVREIGLKID